MSTARASFLSAPRCISATITTDDLNAAAVSQVITLSEKIPAGAIVIGRYLNLIEVFAGGGAGNCTADFGDQADADGWYDGEVVFTGAALGFKSIPGASGVYLDGGGQAPAIDCQALERPIQVTIISNVNVKLLTTGSLGVNVFYVEQAAGDLPA
jgi:hypothetical protein